MMKKLLAALAILAVTASSASAHLTTFTLRTKREDPAFTGITFTRVNDGWRWGASFVPPVIPPASRTFPGVFEPPCMYWVTLHQQGGPDLSSAWEGTRGQMNVCTQRTVYYNGLSGGGLGILTLITFGP